MVTLDGNSLTVADVVSVSRARTVEVTLAPAAVERMELAGGRNRRPVRLAERDRRGLQRPARMVEPERKMRVATRIAIPAS